ncbi:hypothetical protein OPT61_g6099 [Boeremia exigua]|uniref:Uncharacterized protein n=1 Tax=Boeremia exigua TaxID=749465 RepID=A0ACC2I7W2_9PLEO|nr:hypothetical protein OPT61_g6099 [Boeremia exigua]
MPHLARHRAPQQLEAPRERSSSVYQAPAGYQTKAMRNCLAEASVKRIANIAAFVRLWSRERRRSSTYKHGGPCMAPPTSVSCDKMTEAGSYTER